MKNKGFIRILVLTLLVIFIFSLCSCGGLPTDENTDTESNTSVDTKKRITITFNPNGGEITDGKESVETTEGVKFIAVPEVEREGYDFVCWTTEEGEEVEVPFTVPGEDTTYFAYWKKHPIESNTDTTDTSTDAIDTSTDTQKPESSDGGSNKDKQLYSQIKGGEFLEKLGDSTIIKEDKTKVNFSPYRLICTYDELLEFSENASEIDSTIFEENVILYVKQRYPNICGEPVGYSDFKIENGEMFITYSKYVYSLEDAAEAIMYYNDYIVIPKSELPLELERNGTIGVIINVIELNHMEGINKVEEQTVPLNSAWILRTKDEVNEFVATYNITEKAFPYSDEVVVAIYMKRPQKIMYVDEIQNTHQGYLAEVNGSNLKITYLYDENNAGETEYYIDFIILPKEMLDGIEEIEVTLEPRIEPVPNVAKEYDN